MTNRSVTSRVITRLDAITSDTLRINRSGIVHSTNTART